MSIKPRTIDNLGLDASVRYAKDKELFEPHLIEDSRFVAQKTEIPVVKPYVLSEFEQLFALGKTAIWASFLPPSDYFSYDKLLFTFQVIPSLGGYEKQEADLDKLSSLEDALHQRSKKKEFSDKEEEKEEQDRKTLLSFFECIHKLDKTLTLINSRRNQYQRG